MDQQALSILCEISKKLDGVNRLANRSQRNGDVRSLIIPVSIGNNRPQLFAERNNGRVGLIGHNNSGAQLYLALGNGEVEVGETYYTFAVPPDDHIILDQETLFETYKGQIWGVWEQGAPNDSKALITELSVEAGQ